MLIRTIKRWLDARQYKPYDFDLAVKEYLNGLPQRSGRVEIISPNAQFNCRLIVDAEYLLQWAGERASNVISSDEGEQTARLALPLWLESADVNNVDVTVLPEAIKGIVADYATDFLNNGQASVFCLQCCSEALSVNVSSEKGQYDGYFHNVTERWRCHNGHVLREQKMQLRFILKPKLN